MEQLLSLLSDISKIRNKIDIERKNKESRGELFNVFKILDLSTAEVRTHSAFIRELLDPHGAHGLKTAPLSAFLSIVEEVISPKLFHIQTDCASVRVEESIGNITNDYNEGGRIDIIIEAKGNAVIIENKIDAGDQYKQMVRYHNYGKSRFNDNYVLLYLTKSGYKASDSSTCGDQETLVEGEDYYSISYKNHIVRWLNLCLSSAYDKPLVRETLVQYRNLILDLTNTMNTTDLIPILKKEQNITIIRDIVNNLGALYSDLIQNDIPNIHKSIATELGLIEESSNFGNGNGYVYFFRKAWRHAAIAVGKEGRETKTYVSIRGRDGFLNTDKDRLILKTLGNNSAKSYPFGWKYLPDDILYLENINTAAAIINGDYKSKLKAIIQEILIEVESRVPNIGEIDIQ